MMMDIQVRKWGNSLGFRIPRKMAQSFGIEENSIVELTESKNALIITKKQKVSTLDELLSSIPDNYQYPEDVLDFAESKALGQEII